MIGGYALYNRCPVMNYPEWMIRVMTYFFGEPFWVSMSASKLIQTGLFLANCTTAPFVINMTINFNFLGSFICIEKVGWFFKLIFFKAHKEKLNHSWGNNNNSKRHHEIVEHVTYFIKIIPFKIIPVHHVPYMVPFDYFPFSKKSDISLVIKSLLTLI